VHRRMVLDGSILGYVIANLPQVLMSKDEYSFSPSLSVAGEEEYCLRRRVWMFVLLNEMLKNDAQLLGSSAINNA